MEDELLEEIHRNVGNLPKPSMNTNFCQKDKRNFGLEKDGPFEEPEPSIMLIDGTINGIKARILVDTDASLNHISKEFA